MVVVTPAELRALIDAGDVDGVRRAVEAAPELADSILAGPEDGWAETPAIDYVSLGPWHGFGPSAPMEAIAEILLAAGAASSDALLNAASYDAVGVARALIAAGADLEVVGEAVPGGGTALAHAVHFGNTGVAVLLAEAGARVDTAFDAAGIGDLGRMRELHTDADAPRALRAAAVNGQLAAVDALVDLGVPVDVLEGDATALHWAAWEGKLAAVRRLVERGADPTCRDPVHGGTPLGWCQHRRDEVGPGRGHDEVEAYLLEVTAP
jgi:hypothetical protein